MRLTDIIANDKTSHDEFDIGRILADAGVDLSDDDACLDALVAAGVRPWQFKGDWRQAKLEANNLMAARARVRNALREALGSIALLILFLLGGSMVSSGLASSSAAGQVPISHHFARGALVVGFVVVAGFIVSLLIRHREDHQ